MSRYLATFYSIDDNREHALQYVGGQLSENTFNPAEGGRAYYMLNSFPNTPSPDPLPPPTTSETSHSVAMAGLYSSLDQLHYAFIATENNQVHILSYPQPQVHLQGISSHRVSDDPFPAYPAGSIADITALLDLNDNQLYVTVLITNGDLWQLVGTADTVGSWSVIPLLLVAVPGGKHITAFFSPRQQAQHILIATDHDMTVINVVHSDGGLRIPGQEAFIHYDKQIIAISGFYTPDDQRNHVAVAMAAGNGYEIHDIEFHWEFFLEPYAASILHTNDQLLGTVLFSLIDIGTYVTAGDNGRHVVMLEAADPIYPTQLYLSWYYAGWQGFAYAPWPPDPNYPFQVG